MANAQDAVAQVCVLDVTGLTLQSMLATARQQAAQLFDEDPDDLLAEPVEPPQVVARQRFVPHLGHARVPLRWRAQIAVQVHPDVLASRPAT